MHLYGKEIVSNTTLNEYTSGTVRC